MIAFLRKRIVAAVVSSGPKTVNYDTGGLPLMGCIIVDSDDVRYCVTHPCLLRPMWVDRKWCY